ncbi:cation-transporting P-type ATPase, partial [Neobacillus citreus]
MKFHEMEIKQVEKALETDFSSGLSAEEVKKRVKQYGLNELEEGE